MKRIYDYECLTCNHMFDLFREEGERYDEITCPTCGAVSDGKKAKRIVSAAHVIYTQGSVKGRCNSQADW